MEHDTPMTICENEQEIKKLYLECALCPCSCGDVTPKSFICARNREIAEMFEQLQIQNSKSEK